MICVQHYDKPSERSFDFSVGPDINIMSITVGNKEDFQKLVDDELEEVNLNFHLIDANIFLMLHQGESIKVRTATGTEGYLFDIIPCLDFGENHQYLNNAILIKSDESFLQYGDAGVLAYFLDIKNNWLPFAYGVAELAESDGETGETYYICMRLKTALEALGLQGGQFFKLRNNGDTLSVSDKHINDGTALNNTNRDDNGRTASYKEKADERTYQEHEQETYTYSSQLEIAEKTDNKILNLKLLAQMHTNEYHKFVGLSQKWNCVDKSVMHREKFEMMQKHWLEHPGDIRIKGDVRVIFVKKFLISEGSGGTVYLGLGKDGYGKAVKRILKYSCIHLALREKNVLNEANAKKSKHVVKYWNFVEEEGEGFVYLISDLCEQTLTSFVESTRLDKLHEVLPNILRQILNGLSDLHNGPSSILHRDLKPSNVLQDVEGKFMIADFGIKRILKSGSNKHKSHPNRGTQYWIAPESYIDGRYKKESDTMCAGMVAYYVATKGEHAFATEENILKNLLDGNPVGLKKIDDVQLKDFLSWMLQHKPELRPSANEALKHPYLQSNEEKFDMLCDVGNQPEIKQPQYQNSDVRKQLDCPTEWMKRIEDEVLKDFKTFEVNNKERTVTYESSWSSCLRFIRNVGQHWHDKTRSGLSPYIKEGNYKEYFMQRFPELPLLVHKIIRSTDWKTRPDLKKHFTNDNNSEVIIGVSPSTSKPDADDNLDEHLWMNTSISEASKKRKPSVCQSNDNDSFEDSDAIPSLEKGKQRLEVQELLRQPWKCFDKSLIHQKKFKKMEEYGRKHPEKVTLLNELRVIFMKEFLLGKGSDGTRVYLALGNNGYGKAVKRIPKDSGNDFANREKEIFNELNAKRSNYVVNFWDLKENLDEEYLYMILDLCEESLESYVKSSSLQDLQKVVPKVLIQILNGLVHLHSGERPILHRDLRPSNVLRDVQGNFLIADFGISHMLSDETSTHRSIQRGAKYWIAPESYNASDESIDKVRYKKESDILNAGMVAYYVATKGKHPFGPEANRLKNMLDGKPVGLEEIKDVQLKDLLSWMLQRQPGDRPSADKALKHPYLQTGEEKFNMLRDMGNQLEVKHSQGQNSPPSDVHTPLLVHKIIKSTDCKTKPDLKKHFTRFTILMLISVTKLVEQLEEINGKKSEDINCDMDLDVEIERVNGRKNKESPSHNVFLNDGLDMEENEDVAQSLDTCGRSSIQVENSEGSLVWNVGNMDRFRRFLVLGSDTGTFYIGERTLGLENATVVVNLLRAGRSVEVVNEIEKYSIEGRTVRQQAIVFSLAVCARRGDLATKRQAYKALPKICRIPTHLFMFIDFCKLLSQPGKGWGRAHRNAIKRWYKEKDPWKLAMDLTKYQKREGWSHRDVARLMHLKAEGIGVSDELFVLMKYVVCGWQKLFEYFFPEDKTTPHPPIGHHGSAMLVFFRAVETIKTAQEEARVVELINHHNLVREHIPTHWLNSKEVWDALLKKMPMTAMIRNLNKMTSIGLLAEGSPQALDVCKKLCHGDPLRNECIHPFNMLLALTIYKSGKGEKGFLEWKPNEDIIEALEEAFYLSFKNVEPTGKRHMLALDVSGSMQFSRCFGASPVRSHMASAAMALMTARTEQYCKFVAFSQEIVLIGMSSSMKLNEILNIFNEIPKGKTDCARPMLYALENNLKIDVFIVYTDSETNYGKVHPKEALKQYRHHSGIHDAKLIVVAMTSNGFTIADPDDPGMLDIAGFDSAATQVMREFILGDF
ncbi:uncharacterized protein LOC124438154 [Xenia sp. Carnegie-2017]|uniref:uncharacterized protein LOC124438154 n=1 Tax=Xenia sp. Carnegie-2017 TaxID=2897299 RepID=UPI001F0361E1|nr:uncharacterized protein LOC124438154 [Xenia sp. Carnegie-2017]